MFSKYVSEVILALRFPTGGTTPAITMPARTMVAAEDLIRALVAVGTTDQKVTGRLSRITVQDRTGETGKYLRVEWVLSRYVPGRSAGRYECPEW
jgi:hypothetical protein